MFEIAEFETNGVAVLKNSLDAAAVADLIEKLSEIKISHAVKRKKDSVYGVRNLLNLSPAARRFAEGEAVVRTAKSFLGPAARVVRAIYFDKTPETNWKVPWHQDLTIAVAEKRETLGFSAWTLKSGVVHVQPPIEILEKMIALRFHLDDADESNGALKVIPKTHLRGPLSDDEIKTTRRANQGSVCSVKKGDCLIMRPMLLHSSSAGTNPKNRRVIHLEFSAADLPNGLKWYGS